MYIGRDNSPTDWAGYTLVVPTVSVGNVGQLAADLLICTLELKQAGQIYSDSFLPIVGNNPFATASESRETCSIVTATEVYKSEEFKLAVIQQRSPLIKGKAKQYVDWLLDWVHQGHFHKVIILSSSFAHERRDAQLTGSQFRYLLTPAASLETGPQLKEQLGWTELERRPTSSGQDPGGEYELWPGVDFYLPGSGIAKRLLQKCASDGVMAGLLLVFCSEGDNAPDAVQMATQLNSWQKWTNLQTATDSCSTDSSTSAGWKLPPSWRLQYGSTFEQTLFN